MPRRKYMNLDEQSFVEPDSSSDAGPSGERDPLEENVPEEVESDASEETGGEPPAQPERRYRCSECREIFSTRSALTAHLRAKNYHRSKLTCSNCHKVFWNLRFLMRHRKNVCQQRIEAIRRIMG